MLDTRYYEGYEGEGEVKVWSEENGNEDGIVNCTPCQGHFELV